MKNIRKVLTILLISVCFIPSVNALDLKELTSVGDTVKVDKNKSGSSFTIGNSVDITSKIDGLNFEAGNIINDSSQSDYSFVAGNVINLNDNTVKDLFVAGNQINLKSNNIERDVYIAGSTVVIDGTIGRNLSVVAENVTINGQIKGNVVINAASIKVSSDAIINGSLKYNDTAKTSISKKSNVVNIKTYKGISNTKSFVDKSYEMLTSYSNALILGIILIALFGSFINKISEEDISSNNIFKNLVSGLGVLILFPLIAFIVLLTGVGVATSFVSLAIYCILIYISNIITSYYFGKKFLSSKMNSDYLILTLSLLALYVIKFIPILGSIVSIFSILFGMGIIVRNFKNSIKK